MPERKPEDVLTARDLQEQYGLAPRVAESIVRSLLRQGRSGNQSTHLAVPKTRSERSKHAAETRQADARSYDALTRSAL